jgi:hypothetical protein
MLNCNREKAARAIADALIMGDKKAAEKNDLSVRSLVRHRAAMKTDPELAELVAEMREAQKQNWAAEVPEAIAACIQYLKAATNEVSKTDPNAIMAVAQALEKLSDIALTWRMIDERIKATQLASMES